MQDEPKEPFYTKVEDNGVTHQWVTDKNVAHEMALLQANPRIDKDALVRAEKYLKNVYEQGGFSPTQVENNQYIDDIRQQYPTAILTRVDDKGRIYHLTKRLKSQNDSPQDDQLDPNLRVLFSADGFATIKSPANQLSSKGREEIVRVDQLIKHAVFSPILDELASNLFGPRISDEYKLSVPPNAENELVKPTSLSVYVRQKDVLELSDSPFADMLNDRLKALNNIYTKKPKQ